MDVSWYSRFGERGRIQTGPLQASVSGSSQKSDQLSIVMVLCVHVQVPVVTDLKVIVISSPGDVYLEEPFHITCRVSNTRCSVH